MSAYYERFNERNYAEKLKPVKRGRAGKERQWCETLSSWRAPLSCVRNTQHCVRNTQQRCWLPLATDPDQLGADTTEGPWKGHLGKLAQRRLKNWIPRWHNAIEQISSYCYQNQSNMTILIWQCNKYFTWKDTWQMWRGLQIMFQVCVCLC